MAGAHLAAQGPRWGLYPGQNALPSGDILTLTHTDSYCDNLDTPVHLTCTSSECERKPEYLEKTSADMETPCKLHMDSSPSRELIFRPHQHYNEMMLNEMMLKEMTLFKDLLN